eukprot:1438262-Pyramimonas_sp.AAC.1
MWPRQPLRRPWGRLPAPWLAVSAQSWPPPRPWASCSAAPPRPRRRRRPSAVASWGDARP